MTTDRRQFLAGAGALLVLSGSAARALADVLAGRPELVPGYDLDAHWWGMVIDVETCIGCGGCVRACKAENDVPDEPYYFRTWVERYRVLPSDPAHPVVDSPDGGAHGYPAGGPGDAEAKSFFVPKLCNHCVHSPCVQVCPVGATFESPDGVVLVDTEYCLGCRYCVQACPYGCRFIDPRSQTVDKCSLCYHRITKGLTTACCEVCPTGARLLVDLKDPADPVHAFLRERKVHVLKPQMGTDPKVYYAGLDGSVR